jgi:hypothetical protein
MGQTRKKHKNAMLIVEPRRHPALKTVLENFDEHMDPSWDLYVFHGKSAKAFAKKASQGITKRKVILIPLKTNNLTVDAYNALLKSRSFIHKIKAENILLFQTDAALCNKSPYMIDKFTKYNYIGCPYNDHKIGTSDTNGWGKNNFYGVGGLSFRKKSFMLSCIKKNPTISQKFPEDVFYSNCVAKTRKKPKSALILTKFCTQGHFINKSFGAHKTRHMLRKSDRKRFTRYCPKAKEIQSL